MEEESQGTKEYLLGEAPHLPEGIKDLVGQLLELELAGAEFVGSRQPHVLRHILADQPVGCRENGTNPAQAPGSLALQHTLSTAHNSDQLCVPHLRPCSLKDSHHPLPFVKGSVI